VAAPRVAWPRSAWCAYELYKAVADSPPGFLHHIATAAPGLRAVCLFDGFAKGDHEDRVLKAEREAPFPRQLLGKSRHFSLATAQASEASDLRAILAAVGADAQALEATLPLWHGRSGRPARVDVRSQAAAARPRQLAAAQPRA
jgi:hypothetical protein